MWMMGYNEGGEFNNMAADSFGGHKLRPLIPRPSPAAPINNATTTTTTLSCIHGNDLLSFNRHLEQSKKLDQLNTQQVVVSSRWSPTPEQLHILEELYRRGTRTPSTDHIKHITAQLRRYGKIEGKNVFYWFQNHKARERQKRRRQLESPPSDEQQFNAESGANRTGVEFEQTRNWAFPTKFSTLAERSGSSIQRSAVVVKSGGGPDGWLQYEEGELQQHTRSLAERNATWQMMELSFSPPPPINLLINPTSTVTSTTTSPATVRSMDPKLIDADQDFSIFIGTRPHPEDLGRWIAVRNYEEAGSCDESQTLELFPLRSSECTDGKNCLGEESDGSVGAKNVANISTPCQFFEFLPLKN